MNTDEKARYRRLIETKLVEIAEEDALGHDARSTVARDQQAIGRLSRQDALLSQSMARATQSRRDVLAARLRLALDRLETDEYGYCEDCGEDIARKRLDFDPSITLCISCAKG